MKREHSTNRFENANCAGANSLPLSRRQFIRMTSGAGIVAGIGATAGLSEHAVATAPAAGAPRSDYLLGCYTRPWDQFDYRTALDGIAEAGFRYAGIMTAKGKSWVIVNVDSTPEEITVLAREVKQRGLQTLSIYGGDFPVTNSVEAGIKGLRTLIDYCVVCSCPNLLLGGTTDAKLFDDYYKVVTECCAYAAAHKVGLSIKPHGGQNATGPQCRRIIDKVGHSNFRLWYDPGNIFYYSDGALDPADDSATVDGLVVGMSIKDFMPPKEVLLTPGTGKVRFNRVMERLRQGGFRGGPLVVECLTRRETAGEITAEAVKARRFVEELADAVARDH